MCQSSSMWMAASWCLCVPALVAPLALPGPGNTLLAAEVASDSALAGCESQSKAQVSAAIVGEHGIRRHDVESPLQSGKTAIRVLLPTHIAAGTQYPVIYLLPVEAADGHRYGDGLEEARRCGLADKYGAICVAPTFAQLPWYADHPTRTDCRQESYFLDVVVPAVEAHYPARPQAEGRLLVGFSKSGWGALSLLLRHPQQFGKAAAWDAPLMMGWPSKYGSAEIFGDAENFSRYQITSLLDRRGSQLGTAARIILSGYGNFRDDMSRAHARMDQLGIPHTFQDGPHRQHDWHSGWLAEAVAALGIGL